MKTPDNINPAPIPEELSEDYSHADTFGEVSSPEFIPPKENINKYFYRDITKFTQRIAELEKQLEEAFEIVRDSTEKRFTDPLTNCYNRAFLDFYKERVFRPELDDKHLTLFFFDLNNLKQVNDQFGHEAGDELITKASSFLKEFFENQENLSILDSITQDILLHGESDPEIIRNKLQSKNSVIRLGGDEFLVICPSDPQDTPARPEDMPAQIDKIKQESPVSMSSGFAIYDTVFDEASLSGALKRADLAMYKDKQKNEKKRL